MQLTNLMDPVELTRQMIDIPSVSGDEGPLADAVEAALRGAGFGSVPSLEILRDGDPVSASTSAWFSPGTSTPSPSPTTFPVASRSATGPRFCGGAGRSTCSEDARRRSRSRARLALSSVPATRTR